MISIGPTFRSSLSFQPCPDLVGHHHFADTNSSSVLLQGFKELGGLGGWRNREFCKLSNSCGNVPNSGYLKIAFFLKNAADSAELLPRG